MSGILNKKHQLIDLIVTEEGRRQMSMGMFRPTFASFTDKHTFYENSDESTRPTADRIYFQTPSALDTDRIVYEYDDRGRLAFGQDTSFTVSGDQLFVTSSNPLSASLLPQTGSAFASTVNLIKDRVLDAFQKNKFVRSVSGFDVNNDNFKTDVDKHTFAISNSVPFPKGPNDPAVEIDLDNAETFMFDNKLAHVKNFQYLPPVNQDGTEFGT